MLYMLQPRKCHVISPSAKLQHFIIFCKLNIKIKNNTEPKNYFTGVKSNN